MVMANVFRCLWFDGNAEEAAEFYVTLLPNSHVDNVWRSPAETPSGPAGMILTVDFTVAGQQFQGLNGGPDFTFNESVSFVIECDDQAVPQSPLWAASRASRTPTARSVATTATTPSKSTIASAAVTGSSESGTATIASFSSGSTLQVA